MNSADKQFSLFPTRGQDSPLNARNAVLSWTHIFSGAVVNNFRAGLDRANQKQGAPLLQASAPDWPTYLGLKNLNQIPQCNAAPNVSMLGYATAGAGNGNCIIPANTNETFLDTLTMLRGRHSLTIGGEYTRLFLKDIAALNPLGGFNFTGQFSGNSVADYLLGNPLAVSGSKPAALGYLIGYEVSAYANDDIKLTRNFTLNLGVRWQITPRCWKNTTAGACGIRQQDSFGSPIRMVIRAACFRFTRPISLRGSGWRMRPAGTGRSARATALFTIGPPAMTWLGTISSGRFK